MTVPTVSWSEITPAGSDSASGGDDRIRELKTQIREVIDVDHDFPSSGQATDVGQHKQVTLQEQADIGTGAVGATILGSQTISGKGELVYTDEDDTDIQLTSGGKIYLNNGLVTNNTYIKAKDAAGTGTVDLIKADALDVAVLPDGTQTATDAAPTADKDIANKKYVDDSEPVLGAWDASTYTQGNIYQATTDGFVVVYDESAGGAEITGITDSNPTPTTVRCHVQFGSGLHGSFTMPVKKDDYWKVLLADHIAWIPLS